jgi:hypothetical protein
VRRVDRGPSPRAWQGLRPALSVLDRGGTDAPGAVSALTFESPLARIWIETMSPFA